MENRQDQTEQLGQQFFPNREAINFALTVKNDSEFVSGIAAMIFQKNDLSRIDEFKKASKSLISATEGLLGLLPK